MPERESRSAVSHLAGWLSVVLMVCLTFIAAVERREQDALLTAAVTVTVVVGLSRLWDRGRVARAVAAVVHAGTIVLAGFRLLQL